MKNRNLLIAIGVVAGLCLCAGVVAFLVVRQAGKQVMNGVKTDPTEVAQAGARIADYTLPEGYTYMMSMSLFSYNMVFMEPDDGSEIMMIVLAQFAGIDPGNYNDEQFKQQIQRSMEQQSGRRGINMRVIEVKQMTIRGQETSVTISEGQSESGFTMRQLMTAFPAREGMGMVMVQGSAQDWDQKLIDDFLKSIR